MSKEIYRKLRERLDDLSIGFPATDSGVEIRMLEKLFEPEEAALFLRLGMMLEEPEAIAERIGEDPETIAPMLHQMAEKGLLFRLKRDDSARYGALPFAVGWYEFQLGRMDREFAEMFEQYWEESSKESLALGGQLLRPIPVHQSIDPRLPVSTHENCREIVRSQTFLAVADCICRKQQGLLDTACGKPLEVCLVFGSHGKAYVDLGIAREIDADEAVAILDKAEEAGLVPQPANLQKPTAICNCCGDCCGVLRSLNQLENPAAAVLSNYYASVAADLCTGCGECESRCQMNAIEFSDDVAVVLKNRCIGCGLCVTTCPVEAIRLEAKPVEDRNIPPENGMAMMASVAQQRGIPLEKLIGPNKL